MSVTKNISSKSKPEEANNSVGEFELIAEYFAPLATDPGAFGLKDDAASLSPPEGCDLVLTKDALVAGVHFLEDDPADLVARKALRVNISDLAAKGAEPLGYLMSIALPNGWTREWLALFAQGLNQDQSIYGMSLLGGDTVRTPGPLTISVTAIGSVPKGKMVRRGTGQIGDKLYVSGTIGDAALGLQVRQTTEVASAWNLSEIQSQELCQRYKIPEPRHVLAPVLIEFASAAMDISDGLIGDLTKMLQRANIGARVELADIPLSSPASHIIRHDPEALRYVLSGGDDYEVLAAIPPDKSKAYEKAANAVGVSVTCVGGLIEGEQTVSLLDQHGQYVHLTHTSYAHF